MGELQGVVVPFPGPPLHAPPVLRDVGGSELPTQAGTVAVGVPPGPDEQYSALAIVYVVVDVLGGELHPAVS